MWDAWLPADLTWPPASSTTRIKCRRSPRLPSGSASVPHDAGGRRSRAPWSRSSAGLARRKKVTNAETGLPGRPNKSFPPCRPKANGLPGRMATVQKSNCPPISAKACLTQSVAPTETPPLVTTTSHSWNAVRKACFVNTKSSATGGYSLGMAPACPGQGRQAGAIAFVNHARRQGAPRFAQFVTRRQQPHTGAPSNWRRGNARARQQTEALGR